MIGWLLFKLQDFIAHQQVVVLFRWLFLGSMFVSSFEVWFQILTMETVGEREQQAAVSYIEANVPRDRPVLFWGAETSLYLATGRAAPTRVVYQYPLFTLGYETTEISEEMLNSLEEQKPVIIIDTSATNPVVPPLDPEGLAMWHSPEDAYGVTPASDRISSYVAENYEVVDLINGMWPVYKRKQ